MQTLPVDLVRSKIRALWQQVAKFGLVGLFTLVIDVGLFNLLRYGGADGEGVLYDKPVTGKLVSTAVAITVSYFANRHWTFADRARTGFAREYLLFFLISGAAMVISLATLWTSHYALGLTSPLADNLSANVVGLVLGTIFRFWAYRRFVFPESGAVPMDALPDTAAESTSA